MERLEIDVMQVDVGNADWDSKGFVDLVWLGVS